MRRSILDGLRRWSRLLRVFCAVFVLVGVGWVALWGIVALWSWPFYIAYAVVTLTWLPIVLATVAYWWLTLKVVTALIAAPVAAATRAARIEARRLEKSGSAIDADRWRTEVEAPALRLAKETMLALSKGWGTAVGCVSAGATAVALSVVIFMSVAGGDGFQAAGYLICLPFMLVPPLLAMQPPPASVQGSRTRSTASVAAIPISDALQTS